MTVTPAGRALAEYCDEQIDALEARIDDALGTGGRAQFSASLGRCRAAFRTFGAEGDGRVPYATAD